MERFLKRHEDRIVGTIAGFDRILFRGGIRCLEYTKGLEQYLSRQSILHKDFKEFAETITQAIAERAEEIAKQENRPLIYLVSASESKEERARKIATQDGITDGLICILKCVELCQSYQMYRDRETKRLRLEVKPRQCLHYYFYYQDRDFGLMHVRLQSWLPMTIQVCLNGREYLARQLDKLGIGYEQRDNCFVRIDDLKRAQQLMDDLVKLSWAGKLNAFARRVNPWCGARGKEIGLQPYYWTARQMEYATDVMFRDQAALDEIYPALYSHAIDQFASGDVLRFLERRTNSRFAGEVKGSLLHRTEGVRIKHWVEENSIKMYNKKGSVLRIETTINNPRRFKVRRRVKRGGKEVHDWLPMRKGIVDLPRRAQVARSANGRYLEALAVVGAPTPSHKLFDSVSQGKEKKGRRYRALRPVSPEDSHVFRVILRGEFLLQGFRNRDLRQALESDSENNPAQREKAASRMTRLLELLCAHGLIFKVAGRSYYRITKRGRELMGTALKFRDSNVALLAC
jgi:hypothetical protein